MLHDFMTSNRDELIASCRAKVAKRAPTIPAITDKGVPLFLAQLVETLRSEQLTPMRNPPDTPSPAATAIGRAAALHGADLLSRGYTVDQVVHDYGDVCQSVTDMVVEQNASVSPDEFRTLNRCLDDAIAQAVTACAHGQATMSDQAKRMDRGGGSLVLEQRRLVDLAVQTYAAMKTGGVGISGATGKVLDKTLAKLRDLIG